jgi:hypothetical protein
LQTAYDLQGRPTLNIVERQSQAIPPDGIHFTALHYLSNLDQAISERWPEPGGDCVLPETSGADPFGMSGKQRHNVYNVIITQCDQFG